MTFRSLIEESIINLVKPEDKDKYLEIVWDLLNKSYKDIGGIKGSGFETKEKMKSKIKLWKISKKQNKIIAGLLYKDKGIRKTVAVFTDGSKEGKTELLKLLKDDFSRSSIEVSHSLLKFLKHKLPESIKKFAIESKYVSDILDKDIKIVNKYEYIRDINGTPIVKMMLGNIKKFNKI